MSIHSTTFAWSRGRAGFARIARFGSAILVGLAMSLGGLRGVPNVAADDGPSIPWVAPPGAEVASPCIAGRGEFWIEPANWDRSQTGYAGPIYIVSQGQLVGIFYEISVADLMNDGGRWPAMPVEFGGRPLIVDHTEVVRTPAHPGFEEEHYGFRSYLISPAAEDAIAC